MHGKDTWTWVGMNRKSHKEPHMQTWASFLDCIELHKLTIFSTDTTEMQCNYK